MNDLIDPRAAIRSKIRAARRGLCAQERHDIARRLAEQLAGTTLFLRCRHIAFYLPNDGEVDLTPLIERAWSLGKRCYLPTLAPIHHNRLWFAPYESGSPLVLNRFRIPEPTVPWKQMRRTWSLDLILAPLVAFDERGNRLGMGGGFYDRTLAYLSSRVCWRKPRLVGVAYEMQKVDRLPHAPWDVPLEGVITERGLYGFEEPGTLVENPL